MRSFLLNTSYISSSALTQLYDYFATHVPKDKLTLEDAGLSLLLTDEGKTFGSNLIYMFLIIIGLVSINNGYISLANDCLFVVQQVDYSCMYANILIILTITNYKEYIVTIYLPESWKYH